MTLLSEVKGSGELIKSGYVVYSHHAKPGELASGAPER